MNVRSPVRIGDHNPLDPFWLVPASGHRVDRRGRDHLSHCRFILHASKRLPLLRGVDAERGAHLGELGRREKEAVVVAVAREGEVVAIDGVRDEAAGRYGR